MDHILTTNSLSKSFHKQYAVKNISIHVKQGDIYGLIGRNGAGKTTLMRIISGLASPSEGTYSLFGREYPDTAAVRNRVSALIEAPGIYADMSAYENLKAKCIALGVRKKNVENELLETVGLADTGKKPAGKFSLGMKQRLGIALALVGDPDILILDEPINGLDPQGIAEVRNTLKRLNSERGMTFIISSHILSELAKIADNYAIIHKGQLLEELSTEQLFEKCTRKILLNTADESAACVVLEKDGITKYKVTKKNTVEIYERFDDISAITSSLAAAGVPIGGISVRNENLEDYFLNLTGGTENV